MYSLLFGPQSGRLTKAYLQSVLVLLCCPDSGCIRKATSVSDFLLRMSLADVRLRPILGRDLFAALVAIILEEKKAVIGQEWDIVESIQELYCCYVLGCGALNNSATAGTSENLTPNVSVGPGMAQEVTLLEKAQTLWLNRQQGVEEPGCLLTDPRVVSELEFKLQFYIFISVLIMHVCMKYINFIYCLYIITDSFGDSHRDSFASVST